LRIFRQRRRRLGSLDRRFIIGRVGILRFRVAILLDRS
jgi:hypothetical protein